MCTSCGRSMLGGMDVPSRHNRDTAAPRRKNKNKRNVAAAAVAAGSSTAAAPALAANLAEQLTEFLCQLKIWIWCLKLD
jgi:hypothetical protein